MNFSRILRSELSISSRLLVWFLAISLIPLGIMTLVVSYISTRSLEQTVRRGLSVISESKVAAIETFIRQRRGDATVAGHIPAVVAATRSLNELLKKSSIDSPEYEKESMKARGILSVYRDSYGYKNAYLFSIDGKLLLRLQTDIEPGPNLLEGPLKQSELADLFLRAKMLLQAVSADFEIYPGVSQPLTFVAHPVFDDNGLTLGVIVLQIGNQEMYRILNDYTGLGMTGETVAGRAVGDEVTIVAPTRFDPTAAFKRKSRISSDSSSALHQAVQGARGYGDSVDYNGHQTVAVHSYIPSARLGLVVKMDRSEAYEMIYYQRLAVGGLLAVTLGLVVTTALLVARSLSRPIQAAAEAARRVAAGDLTAQVDVRAKGEAGRLLRAIQTMTQDLRTLIGKIQKSSIALLSTATEIAATSRQTEQTMHEHGTSTNEAAAAVKEISATGQELAQTMSELNQVAAQSASMASHGQESLGLMDKTMRTLADSTGSISSKLSVISERAANINLAVTTITKVADQTNLLSINAAIEAEKAGEYGLGFLVVAREIRRLADMTAVSTLDIERMVKEMQYSVSAGVMEMDKFSDQVRQGVREVAQVNEKLGLIIESVQVLTTRFDHVTEGMKVQAQGADQIREAVVRLSEGTGQTLSSLREFNLATGQLREAVGELKEEVSRFRVDAVTVG
jgi:methyl-accepting chemotaxis protein WspA